MIGQTISHYKIVEKLGEGGMGVVYKAHDTKLDRDVALKFLKPQSLGSSEDKTRFLTEAQAAASLDHPNICTIHAIEEAEGQTFIVMAFLEGESLKEKIQRGPLKVDEVLDISIQVADGLHLAHQKGIIHRDVKSGNIMLSVLGLVKIMDFGLARLSGRTSITETGTTLGTPGYMSPEQARGEKVDHRTDIWSLGVVMYEMITGRLPFRGDYQEAVIYSILNEQPEPPTSLRTGVPMELERIVSKAMAKDANERYQHLDELLVDLKRLKKDTEQKEPTQQLPARGKEYRKLSAIMFSDIVAYSKIMQQDEDLAMDLLSRHNQLVRDAIKKHNGTEIKVIGDAFLVDFETVATAVRCAIEIQETISKYNEDKPESQRILLRIGIHVGDVIVKGNDVFGDGVNIASRIEPLAEPGGICISQEVYNMVKHKLDVQVVSLGPKELKNIKDKIEIYEILVGSIAGKELSAVGRRIVSRSKPFYKKPAVWIAGGVILAAVVVGIVMLWPRGPEQPTQFISRVLKAKNNETHVVNISPDGNWVVYAALDKKEIDNVFVQHISSGEPRQITNDTIAYSRTGYLSFSYDASEILYNRIDRYFDSTISSYKAVPCIYKVSTLGGSPMKLISDAFHPDMSPDGKNLCYLRMGDKAMLVYVANSDGSAPRSVVDLPWTGFVGQHYGVTWSPDSKRLAYLRNFITEEKQPYSEIFIRDISTGKEEQLTFEKKEITDLCWGNTGDVVYSVVQNTDINLWLISDRGGTPRQLTFEPGKSTSPKISRDGKRLIYNRVSESVNLWAVNLETNDMWQLTFEEAKFVAPRISPDGKKILYSTFDNLFVCNTDGSEPIQITRLPKNVFLLQWTHRWSGNESAIAYSVQRRDTVSSNPDSIQYVKETWIQDLASNTRKIAGKGELINWSLDSKYMIVRGAPDQKDQYFLVLATSLEEHLKEIRSVASPSFTLDGKYVLYSDSAYLWNLSLESFKTRKLRKFPHGFNSTYEMADGKSIFQRTWDEKRMKFGCFKFPKEGTSIEKIGEFSAQLWGSSISPDMKTLIISKGETRNKIIVIDNFR